MRIILTVLFMTLASQAQAGFCTMKWYATITDEARVNSKGERLTTIGQVLAQHLTFPKGVKDFTKIPGNKFYISTKERKAFWECSKIRFKIEMTGWDCHAEAVDTVEMWSLLKGSHQCFK